MKDFLQDIIEFLLEHEHELPLSFSNDLEREAYANNLLDGIRYSSLQRTLESLDPDSTTGEFEHLLKEAIQYKNRRQTLDFFNELDQKSEGDTATETVKPKIIPLRQYPVRILAIAAAVALCITAGWWFWSMNTSSPSGLYSKYFNVPAHKYLMRGNDTPDPEINSAFTLFDQGNYEMAIPLLDKLYDETKNNDFLFYKAIALLETSDVNTARPILRDLSINQPQNMNYRWYYALSLLRSDQKQEALAELQTVADSDHFRSSSARKLIRDLNR